MQPAILRFLATLSASLLVAHSAFAQQSEWDGTPVSTTVYVNFAYGSARFQPTEESAATLASAVDAALITIRGRTSTGKPTTRDEALALARAIAARYYLIAGGVSPLKIHLNYASATDFIADNSTTDGQLLNQRVEVDILHVPLQQAMTMEQKYQAALAKRAMEKLQKDLTTVSKTAFLQ